MAPRAKAEQADAGTVSVNVEEFQRTRDSVIVALATLQSSVQDLSRAYINHANTVLSGQSSAPLSLDLTGTLLSTGLVNQQQARQSSAPASDAAGETKKKRKRAPHDPNAPKRALTPYFLYMQSARAQIAAELGDNAKPKEVADEGTRRWAAMAPEDKSVWNALYARNLAIYREKMKAYKAQQPVPTDEEAAELVDSSEVPIEAAVDTLEADEDDEDSPEPVKAPSPPKGKRRKTADKVATPAKETPAAATPAKASPEKKKKEKKEKATPAAAPKAAPAPAAESGKKKKAAKK